MNTRLTNFLGPSYKPKAKPLKNNHQSRVVVTPAGFEPATFSLEGCILPLFLLLFSALCRGYVAARP